MSQSSGTDHPLRSSLTQEMHLRRLPRFSAPARALHWLVLNREEANGTTAFGHVVDLFRRLGRAAPARTKHATLAIDALQVVWEEHSEFSTYTFVRQDPFDEPFDKFELSELPDGWLESLPGLTFRATKVAILAGPTPEPEPALIGRLFSTDDVVCCDVFDGKARVWTDFRKAADGFGRLLIKDNDLRGDDPSRLVQQLLELGNYRKMALLGLPIAQSLGKELREAEGHLAELSRRIAEGQDDDEALLHEISSVSAKLARLAADTRYRLGATRAYANIVTDRLENLGVQRLPGSASLREFNERRLWPAVRTCETATQRLEGLQEQASWTNGLIRTRIDTAMNRQSRDLLASMNRRTQIQLRLQQTVEGLSVAAISYYVVGLVHYIVEGIGEHRLGISSAVVTGASVPFVVAFTALTMHRIRQVMTNGHGLSR